MSNNSKIITMEDGSVYELVGRLGEPGGQGAVYQAKSKKDGNIYALKIYHKPPKPVFLKNLQNNVVMGSPHSAFVWPIMITEPIGKSHDRIGYVMDMYGKEYSSFVKLVKGKANFPSFGLQIKALIELCEAFEALHAKGYSYQDLNDGGVVFDCAKGRVRICDNDNVAPYGVNLGIQGMFKYMAPEVQINMFLPDTHSDRFSLAVLMYLILCRAHPLDGIKRLSGPLTAQLQEKVYGTEPVFTFHPTDASNRPDPNVDKNVTARWSSLPDFLQRRFIKTFTAGMPHIGRQKSDIHNERQQRTTESEWIDALNRWIDVSFECPHCQGATHLPIQNGALTPGRCVQCGKHLAPKLPILQVEKNGRLVKQIVLHAGKPVTRRSLLGESTNKVAFAVQEHPTKKGLLGIVNRMDYGWRCSQAGASDKVIDAGKVVPVGGGIHIQFSNDFLGKIIFN